MSDEATGRQLPGRRARHTTAVTIGGERIYLTASPGDDDALGEVLIQWGRKDTSSAGLMDTYALALSAALQHHVPLRELVRQGLGLHFAPDGHTDDPDIPWVRSIADYIAQRLAADWLPADERAALGIHPTVEDDLSQARAARLAAA